MGPRRKPSASIGTALDASKEAGPGTITVIPPTAPAPAASNIPRPLQFPLVVLISFSVSVLSKTIYYELHGPLLGPISKDGDPNSQLLLTASWKILELALGWFSGFDALDMFYFTVLTHVPHGFLLYTFYLVPLSSYLALLLTTCVANVVPTFLLRRPSSFHLPTAITDERLTSDRTIRLATSLLCTVLYSIPLLFSLATWLPAHLAVYFTGLKTLTPAHNATLASLAIILLPLGYYASNFSFAPAAHALSAAAPTTYTVPLEFDPVSATLSQTLHRNVMWHLYLPARAQEALRRTALLVLWTLANTTFWALVEVEGSEWVGAFGWASVWGLGAGLAGIAMGWVAGIMV